jgi:ribosomal small subunit protein bTHX
MGKGDKRTKKGKINSGSYGNSRPKPTNSYPAKKDKKA